MTYHSNINCLVPVLEVCTLHEKCWLPTWKRSSQVFFCVSNVLHMRYARFVKRMFRGGCLSYPMMTFTFCNSSELGGGSAVLAWKRRVLNSGETGSQLWWSLLTLPCGAYLWQQWVSGVELPRSWQQLCGLRLSTLVCPWLTTPALSAWCDTTWDSLWRCLCIAALGGLGFSCRAGALHTSGVLTSETPPCELHAPPIEVGPWWAWTRCWWSLHCPEPQDWWCGPAGWFRVWNEELTCGKTIQCPRFITVEEGETFSFVDVAWALSCGICPAPGLPCLFLSRFLCPGSHRRKWCFQDTWNVQNWQVVCRQ